MGAGEQTAPGAKFGKGCPPSYDVLPGGVAGVDYAAMGSYQQMFWGRRRLRFLLTPGHGPHASSVLLDHGGKQVVFCGDAVHAGGTLWQPYHLEWDHWLGTGALAASEGVGRLRALPIDLLCPAHGPVIGQEIAATLETLAGRLMAFYEAKGNVSPGEPDLFLEPKHRASGARQVLDGLYQFGLNGYLLVAANGEALVIDPTLRDIPELERLTAELAADPSGEPYTLATAVATHYHSDHTDALPLLRERYGTTLWLHPEVAAPLRDVDRLDAPWLPAASIEPDRLLPADEDLGVERAPLPRRPLAQPDLVALPADDHRGRPPRRLQRRLLQSHLALQRHRRLLRPQPLPLPGGLRRQRATADRVGRPK